MGITYRHLKGSPLTSAEVDANFESLDQRLRLLEGARASPADLVHIEQHDTRLRFLDPSGRTLGDVELPTPRFAPKGAWETAHVYEKGDLVAHEAHTWYAMRSHEAGTFEEDRSQGLWNMFL
ncbi:MAG: hypothetical protein LBJ70_03255 [Holosporales bacterium]|jgi:hypothetical protein|nr:hypothetical protein [Holosporales bacterium]